MRLRIVAAIPAGDVSFTLTRRETADCLRVGDNAPCGTASLAVASALSDFLASSGIADDGWCFVWRLAQRFLEAGSLTAQYRWEGFCLDFSIVPH